MGVSVGVSVGVGDGVSVGVAVGVSVGVAVGVGVLVGVAVNVPNDDTSPCVRAGWVVDTASKATKPVAIRFATQTPPRGA